MESINRTCKVCNNIKDLITEFSFHSATGYYSRTCKDCLNTKRRNSRPITKGRRENSIYISQKKCLKCNIIKDTTEFKKRSKGKNFLNVCISCVEEKKEKYLESITTKGPLSENTIKNCIICKQDKPISNFSYSKNIGYYSSYCKTCDIIRKQNYIKTLTPIQYEELKAKGRNYHKINKHKSLMSSYRKFDFNKNLENDLTPEYIKTELGKACTYCGHPSTGLDRIKNSLGHLQSNCVPCCWECNTAKMNNFSYEEMFVIGQAIKLVKNNRKCQIYI